MPVDIPPEVRGAVTTMVERLKAVAPKHEKQLVGIAEDLIVTLSARMRQLAGSNLKFERTATAARIVQLQALVEKLGVKHGVQMGNAVRGIGTKAAAIGRGALRKELRTWASVLPGSAGRFVQPDLASALLDPGLLEHYAVSRQTYGMEAITAMRGELARGVLEGEALKATWDRMAARLALPTWRAERIVRTEHSLAANRRKLLDMEEMFGEADKRTGKVHVAGWWKELVATFDRRTGDDSRFVHGQRRRLDKPFEDDEGRVYMAPPNRPNDREVVIFVPDEAG